MIVIVIVIVLLLIIMMIIMIIMIISNGVGTNGVTANCMVSDRGFLVALPSAYFCLPESARAYLFPNLSKLVTLRGRHTSGIPLPKCNTEAHNNITRSYNTKEVRQNN